MIIIELSLTLILFHFQDFEATLIFLNVTRGLAEATVKRMNTWKQALLLFYFYLCVKAASGEPLQEVDHCSALGESLGSFRSPNLLHAISHVFTPPASRFAFVPLLGLSNQPPPLRKRRGYHTADSAPTSRYFCRHHPRRDPERRHHHRTHRRQRPRDHRPPPRPRAGTRPALRAAARPAARPPSKEGPAPPPAPAAPRIQAKDHPAGSVRPVYFIQGFYPRLVDASRAPAYSPVDGQALSVPLGHIPEVAHTFAYWDANYALANEAGVAMSESTCGSKTIGFPVSQPGGKSLLCIEELSRIGLERCDTARCAVRVMGELAVQYGCAGPALPERTISRTLTPPPGALQVLQHGGRDPRKSVAQRLRGVLDCERPG